MNEAGDIPWIQSESMFPPCLFPGIYWLLIKMINCKPISSCAPILTFVLELFTLEFFFHALPQGW